MPTEITDRHKKATGIVIEVHYANGLGSTTQVQHINSPHRLSALLTLALSHLSAQSVPIAGEGDVRQVGLKHQLNINTGARPL